MRLLLDTHALVWWLADNPQLSARARAQILDETHAVFVSAATAWEVATKHRLGKWPEAAPVVTDYHGLVTIDGFIHLPVSPVHALRAGSLDVDHRDPFDRLLAAQAELEGLTLVTCDPVFARFDIPTLW